jgi:hypothetical protein
MTVRRDRILEHASILLTIACFDEKMEHCAVVPEVPRHLRSVACCVTDYPLHSARTLTETTFGYCQPTFGYVHNAERRVPCVEKTIYQPGCTSTRIDYLGGSRNTGLFNELQRQGRLCLKPADLVLSFGLVRSLPMALDVRSPPPHLKPVRLGIRALMPDGPSSVPFHNGLLDRPCASVSIRI